MDGGGARPFGRQHPRGPQDNSGLGHRGPLLSGAVRGAGAKNSTFC
ncbi:hypothetical protein SLNWT_0573 [Streptomyces albus]|uniref:Uncharacterized protein n=1 Tax=Streptomyces albus (strain ATCC 21838 / DSM 41398 / FERM P-419 / JCM 4703 / NBRC 107858) TaxID=1081613 RepID=A0A0B5EHS9_STRA4|nr:hypothetical protein SLNWT_0573 [Streptomyces albus]